MTINAIMRRFIALFACLCLAASTTGIAWAQAGSNQANSNQKQAIGTNGIAFGGFDSANSDIQLFLAQADTSLGFDITAPTITHTPSVSKGVAGEVQTVVAEISDNQSVASAQLIYRNSSADFYSTTQMSADVTNTTWLATIDTSTEDSLVNYYIVAEDTDGNRVQKGSESSPLTLTLQEAEVFSAVAPLKKDNRTTWIGVGLGILVVGALLAAGGGSGGDDGGIVNSDGANECCTITIVAPNVDTN